MFGSLQDFISQFLAVPTFRRDNQTSRHTYLNSHFTDDLPNHVSAFMAPVEKDVEENGISPYADPTFASMHSWLEKYGTAEYVLYKRRNPSRPMQYDDWAISDQARGAYMYQLAMNAWDDVSSSVSRPISVFSTVPQTNAPSPRDLLSLYLAQQSKIRTKRKTKTRLHTHLLPTRSLYPNPSQVIRYVENIYHYLFPY